MALERRPGGDAVPVRPALTGAIVGVLAVTAALTVHQGITDTVAQPSRAGQTIDAGYYAGKLKDAAVTGDPDIARASEVTRTVADMDGLPVPTYTVRPIGTGLETVIIDGRAPRAADEVTLGPSSADVLGVEVGDTLPAGPDGTAPLRVVGTALLFEEGGHAGYDEGAWLTPAGVERIDAPDPDWAYVSSTPGRAPTPPRSTSAWPQRAASATANGPDCRSPPSTTSTPPATCRPTSPSPGPARRGRAGAHARVAPSGAGVRTSRSCGRSASRHARPARRRGVAGHHRGRDRRRAGGAARHPAGRRGVARDRDLDADRPRGAGIGLAVLLVAPATLLLANLVALWPAGGRPGGARGRPARPVARAPYCGVPPRRARRRRGGSRFSSSGRSSFEKIELTCFSTVRWLRKRLSAIAAFERPAAIPANTSRSRSVSSASSPRAT